MLIFIKFTLDLYFFSNYLRCVRVTE